MIKLLKILIPILIVLGAWQLFKVIAATKDEPEAREAKEVVPMVDVKTVEIADHAVSVRSYGTVQSYYESSITPQVTGRIIELSPRFRVGERVKKGELLVTIDATDYVAALATQEANLTIQQRGLQEEVIRAKQASEDWKASGRSIDTASDFVLRKPQLAAAKANIAAVEAAIVKAKADIQRTKLVAPFDAIVTKRTTSPGDFATSQANLGSLVATEKAEVRLPLTAEQVSQIKLPKYRGPLEKVTENPVIIHLKNPSNPDEVWQAELSRTEPTIDPQNQVTYVIATIKNPYDNGAILPVGSFVNAVIPGKTISQAYKFAESALVNDSYIWVVDKDDKLRKVVANRLHSEAGGVIVKISNKSKETTLRVVTRPLSNFREGDKVKENTKKSSTQSDEPKG